MSSYKSIPPEFIDQLLSRIDIVDVINARVPLKKAGNSYKACCPFHQEKTPSFTVSYDKQLYHCFGCGASGSAVTFVMNFEQISFVEAIETLAQMEGMSVPYIQNSQPQKTFEETDNEATLLRYVTEADLFFRNQLRVHPDKERVIAYLKKRGISGQTALQFGIGYAPDGWRSLLDHLVQKGAKLPQLIEAGLITQKDENTTYDRFRDRIMFPIRDRKGQTIAFGGRILDQGEPKYLNSPETSFFHKGNHLYGIYELRSNPKLRNTNTIIVVEGYMDVVMLTNYGIFNVVATLGTATSKFQVEQLFKLVKRVIFCFDGDKAGHDAAWKALNVSLPILKTGRELTFLFLPDGEDPDSLVQKEGNEAFLARTEKADSFSQYLFNKLEQDIDLSTLEGKAILLESAGKMINQMPDTPLRDLLRETLAQKTQASNKTLNKHAPQGEYVSKFQKIENNTRLKKRTPIQKAIILLLNNIELVSQLTLDVDFLADINLPGADTLYEILQLAERHHWKNAAQIITHYAENPSLQKALFKLSEVNVISDERLQLNELSEILLRLRSENQAQQDPFKLALSKLKSGETLNAQEIELIQKNSKL